MKESQDEIVKDLHFLLETKTPYDFLAASKRRGISTYLKSSLEYLALECLSKLNKRNLYEAELHSPHRVSKPATKRKAPTQRLYGVSGKIDISQIYEIVINSRRFSRKDAINNFARKFNLVVPINKKDSRSRAANKLAKAIFYSPINKQKQILSALLEDVDKQTKGWLDIIRTD